MDRLSTWLILLLTLPTDNATARMRFWRALKAKGCVVLRDGAYLLPNGAAREEELLELVNEVVEARGNAHLFCAPSRNAAQEEEFRGLFCRSDDYAEFIRSLAEIRKTLSGQSAAELARLLRRLRKDIEAIRAIDYFPSDSATRADVAWQDFVALVDTVLSPGEPQPIEGAIQRLQHNDFQGRTWATRQRLWVDRVASAWLIRRFIDLEARFLWLASPNDCPIDALGFDFEGAAFTHIGDRVTFEVLLDSFGLGEDPGLLRLGEIVHALDVGGISIEEASGFEAVLSGASHRISDDDQLLAEMSRVLDSLYAHFSMSAN